MLKHTPGPWHHQKGDRYIRQYSSEAEKNGYWNDAATIAETHHLNSEEETQANNKIIAAAPEMLEALIKIVDGRCSQPCNLVCGEYCSLYNAKKAIESATDLSIEEVLKC